MQIWEVLEKRQNINKMKDNLSQECVKGELRSFRGKIGTIAPDFP